MSKINSHPILDVPKRDKVVFTFNGKKIEGGSKQKEEMLLLFFLRGGGPSRPHCIRRGIPCIVIAWMGGDVLWLVALENVVLVK